MKVKNIYLRKRLKTKNKLRNEKTLTRTLIKRVITPESETINSLNQEIMTKEQVTSLSKYNTN